MRNQYRTFQSTVGTHITRLGVQTVVTVGQQMLKDLLANFPDTESISFLFSLPPIYFHILILPFGYLFIYLFILFIPAFFYSFLSFLLPSHLSLLFITLRIIRIIYVVLSSSFTNCRYSSFIYRISSFIKF